MKIKSELIILSAIALVLIVAIVFVLSIGAEQEGIRVNETNETLNKTTGENVSAKPITNVSVVPELNVSKILLDKKEYSSFENVILTAVVYSNIEGNFSAKVHGIAPLGFDNVRKEEEIEIKPGKNNIMVNFKTPSCTSGCGGVKPGNYRIFLEIWKEGEILANATTTITLVSSH